MIKTKNRSTHRSSEQATQNNFTLTSTMNASMNSTINKTGPTSTNEHMTRSYDNYSNSNNIHNVNMEKNSLPVTPMASAAITNVARHVEEDYNKMLDTVSMPNYKTIKTLLSSSYNTGDNYDKHNDGTPSEIIPGIQVSFELFETVQNRFALTRQNLERTKTELLNRNSQYSALQAQLQTLTDEFEVLSKRNKNLECAHNDLQQVVAKQEVMLEVLRKENSTVKSDALLFQERLLNKEEENQVLQNKVTEGMVMIAQKDAAINTLRRELGRFGRFTTHQRGRHRVRRDGSHTTTTTTNGDYNKGEGDKQYEEGEEEPEEFDENDEDDVNHVYTAEALEGIAAEVEERSLEARMKMKIADLERTVNSLEKEKQLICDQHTNYRSYVEGVMEAATSECLTLQDEMRRHVCVTTPYLLSSTFFGKLHALESNKINDRSSNIINNKDDADGVTSGHRSRHHSHNFDTLTTYIGSLLERTKNIDIDSSSVMCNGLNDNVMAYSKVMNVCEELSSLFRTFEEQLLTRSNSIYEMKEEWNKAQIHLFTTRAKDELNLSITQLHKSLMELLKRENEYRDSLKSSPNTTPPLRAIDENTVTPQSTNAPTTTTKTAINDLDSNNSDMNKEKASLQERENHDLSSPASSSLISGQPMREGNNNNNNSSNTINDINNENTATRKDVSSGTVNAISVNSNRIELATQTDISYKANDVSDIGNSANSKNETRGNAMYFVDGKLIDVNGNSIELCDRCSSVLVHHSRQSTESDSLLGRQSNITEKNKMSEELKNKERSLEQQRENSAKKEVQENEESLLLSSLNGSDVYRLHVEIDDTFHHLLLAMCPCCNHKWDIFSCECADDTKFYAAQLHDSKLRTPMKSANEDKQRIHEATAIHDRINKLNGISSTDNNSDVDDANQITSMTDVPNEAAVGAKTDGWKESTLPYVMKHEMSYASANENISESTETWNYNRGSSAAAANTTIVSTSDNINQDENADQETTSSPSHSASSTRRKKPKSKKKSKQKDKNLSTLESPLSESTSSSLSVSKKMLSSSTSNAHNSLKVTSAQDKDRKDHVHHHHMYNNRMTPENAAESSSSCLSVLSSSSAPSTSLSTSINVKVPPASSSSPHSGSLQIRMNYDDSTPTIDKQQRQNDKVASSGGVYNDGQTFNNLTPAHKLLEHSDNVNITEGVDHESNTQLPLTQNNQGLQSIKFNDVNWSNDNKLIDGHVQRPLSTSSHINTSATVANANNIANENDKNANNVAIADEEMSISQALMQNKNLMEQLQMLQEMLQCKEQELTELSDIRTKTNTPHYLTEKNTLSVAVQTNDLNSTTQVEYNWNDLTSNSGANNYAQSKVNTAAVENKASNAQDKPLSYSAPTENDQNTLSFINSNKGKNKKLENTSTAQSQIAKAERRPAQDAKSTLSKSEDSANRASSQTTMNANINTKVNTSTSYNNANKSSDKLTQGSKDKKVDIGKEAVHAGLENKLPNVQNKLVGAKELVNRGKPQMSTSYARTARSVKKGQMLPLPLSSRTAQSSSECLDENNSSSSVQLAKQQQNKLMKSPFEKLFNEKHVPLHVHAIQLNQLLNAQLPNLDYRLPNATSASFYPRLAPLNQQGTLVGALYDGEPHSSSSHQRRDGESEIQTDGMHSMEYTSTSNKLNLPFTEYKLSNSAMKELAELEELRAKERQAQFTNTYDAQKMKSFNKWHEQQMIAKHIAAQRVISKAHTLPPYARNVNTIYGANNRSALSVQSYKDYQDTHSNYHQPSESPYTEIQKAIIAKMQEHSNEHNTSDLIPYDNSSFMEMYSLTRPIPSMRKWSNTSSNSTSIRSLHMENVNNSQNKYNTNNRYLYYKLLQPPPSIVAPMSRQAYFTRNGRWQRGLTCYPQNNTLTLLASCTPNEMYSTPPLTINELLTLQRWKQQQKKRRLTLLKAKRDPYFTPGKNTNTINYVRRVQLMKKQHKWYNKQQQQQQQLYQEQENLQANQMLIGKRLNTKSENSTTL